MKIKTRTLSYEKILELPKAEHRDPVQPNPFLRVLIRTLSKMDLKKVDFSFDTSGMEKLGKREPALILMNHSSFIDLEIASLLLKDHPFQIVCTSDGFVGKEKLMYQIGCIPTQKFVTDITLIRDIQYALQKLKTSVLMYPEASYSFDGTETPLPESLGKCVKLLKAPIIMIRTHGAFLRDPLYNMLQKRETKVTAELRYVLSPEEIEMMRPDEINEVLKREFTYDHFKEQQENKIRIDESFRADGLSRVLYKCPVCQTEGKMKAGGTKISCGCCRAEWELSEYGKLIRKDSLNENLKDENFDFSHIPDWYRWEREEVKKELLEGSYRLDIPVDIYMMVDRKAVYKAGEGQLKHSTEGFCLDGIEGKLHYTQSAAASYSLYADYFWYEIGDMICIGDRKTSYYCFPKETADVAAKTRLACEELYKIRKSERTVKN